MKDKTRVTAMVCTAADGYCCPLAIIGKSKRPVCFDLLCGSKTPLLYKEQSNAWFDRNVTVWWINNVFWPDHLHCNGHGVNAILILDNCTAHQIDMSLLPPNLTIMFLPPNVTSRHQPADMGMIAALKAGYKSLYLHTLLCIFDIPGVRVRR